jgi:chromosome segregation ATPase
MSSGSRVENLVSTCARNHRRVAQVESFVTQLESQSQIPEQKHPPPAKDSYSDLFDRLSSIQHRMQSVAVSVHSFAQLANSLQSRYSKLIVHPPFSRDYSVPTLFQSKLSELREQRSHLRTRRARLKAKFDELSRRLQEIEERELAAHKSICDPLADCKLEEIAVAKLERELDRLRLKQTDIPEVTPLKKVPPVDFRLRRAEIRSRITEIQVAERELREKLNFIPPDRRSRRAREDKEVPLPELEDFHEKCEECQEAIDRVNRELDDLCALNHDQRQEVEAEYDVKLRRIALLTDEVEECDRTRLQIHEMSGAVALAQDRQHQLSDDRRHRERGMELSKGQAMAVEKVAAQNLEANGRLRRRKANLRDKEQALAHRRQVLGQERANAELLVRHNYLLEQRVLDVEKKVTDCEKQCDAFNENLKLEAQAVDRVLFQASSMRADSRVQRLNELLEARTESTLTWTRTIPRTDEVVGAKASAPRSRISLRDAS